MKATSLPSLQSTIPNALQLSRQILRAVGSVESQWGRKAAGSAPASLAALKTLFTAANDHLDSLGAKTRSLDVTPNSFATLDVSLTTTQQLVATRTRQDGTTGVVTGTTTWESANPAVAAVSSGGLVTPVAPGSTTIKGTYQGVSDSVPVTVQA